LIPPRGECDGVRGRSCCRDATAED